MICMVTPMTADERTVTVAWDKYTTPPSAPATALKLFMGAEPSIDNAETLAFSIPIADTTYVHTLEGAVGDTFWFTMQAVNRDVDPTIWSELSEWVPWTWQQIDPTDPMPVKGIRVTTIYEIVP